MKLLSELLGKSKMHLPLTTKQYVAARDAGFTTQELQGEDYAWYSEHRDEITYNADDTIKPRHIAVLKAEGYEIDVEGLTYYDGRKAMRELAKAMGEDKRYLDAIAAIEKDYAGRKLRKRAKPDDEQDVSEAQAAWTHYRKEYRLKFGVPSPEQADAQLLELIITTLDKMGLEPLQKAITYCVHDHDHGKFAVNLRDLLTRDWLLNVCIQGSADSRTTRRKAQERGLTEAQYLRAERRGEIPAEGDLSELRQAAMLRIAKICKQQGLLGQEKRAFMHRPEFVELFKTVSDAADIQYVTNAIAILERELTESDIKPSVT